MPRLFRYGLVGEGSLLIACCQVLLRRGNTVALVATADPAVALWAPTRKITRVDEGSGLFEALSHAKIDYLFGISNSHMLDESILKTPRYAAISYHNGPLRNDADRLATSWTILGGERTHVITWHMMQEGVRPGAILRQYSVPVTDDETALTLNLKCFEIARKLFEELIDEVALGNLNIRAGDLRKRTSMASNLRLPNGGIIDWRLHAHQIARLIRALDFGPYPNFLSTPKLLFRQRLVSPQRVEVLNVSSAAPAGTVLAIASEALEVATADRVVRLMQFQTLEGEALEIRAWAKQEGISLGTRLPQVEVSLASDVAAMEAKIDCHEQYWVQQLKQLHPPVLPHVRIGNGPLASCTMLTPKSVRRDGCSNAIEAEDRVFVAVLAYLARLCGEDAFDVGRILPVEELPKGMMRTFFASVVPHRVNVNASEPVAEVLAALARQWRAARSQHTYTADVIGRCPALKQVEELRSAYPFTVVLARASDFEVSARGRHLSIVVSPGADHCEWFYDPVAIDEKAIVAMMEQFEKFCQSADSAPSQSLGDLPILSNAQLHRLTVEWNQTQNEFPRNQSLHGLFEAKARHSPDAVAVICGGERCTYHGLDVRASEIARRLRASGVRRGSRVLLYTGRSIDAVAAMMGVLKIGAAYVPVEPTTPSHRVKSIALQVEPEAILTDFARWEAMLVVQEQAGTTPRMFCLGRSKPDHGERSTSPIRYLNDVAPAEEAESKDNLSGAQELAYIIFTSGSTGVPKGVAVSHRAAVNLVDWVNRTFRVDASDMVLSISSFSFDLSVYDIFGTLAAGGTLRLADDDEVRDPRRLLKILRHEPITFWNSAPAALQQVTGLFPDHPRILSGTLRLVFLSGDWVPLSLPPLLKSRFPGAQIIALGGATEATIWSNWFEVGSIDPHWTSIPYGRPIQNAQYYVLDKRMHACPVGVEGDLYIAGSCLAEGYFRAPELTAERFIVDPFGRVADRMYVTGDRARFLADGNIEFRGRRDGQVKIRGFRVELGEIEAVLEAHMSVRQAVVIAHHTNFHTKQLVAYVVAAEQTGSSASDLSGYLAGILPRYMIPAAFVMVPHLPLTPNGKVDRRGLPPPPISSANRCEPFEPPVTERERQIAEIWRNVLRISEVGRQDTFFALGGDSLMSVEVVVQAASMNLEVSPKDLYEHPTLAELAQVVQPRRKARTSISALTYRSSEEFPLTPIQHWLFERGLQDPEHYNIALLFDVTGNPDRLIGAIESVAVEHDAFFLRFDRHKGRWRQRMGVPAVQCDKVDLQGLTPEQEVTAIRAVLNNSRRNMDLAKGPLLKAILFDCGGRWKLGVVAHHLIFDGASLRIWLDNVQAHYSQRRFNSRGTTKPNSFSDWARCLASFAHSSEAEEYLDAWLALPWAQIKPLTLDIAGRVNSYRSSASLTQTLGAADTVLLLREAPQAWRTSTGELLLAAWGRAMCAWVDVPAVLVEVTGHGRTSFLENVDISRTIGYLTTNSPSILQAEQQIPDHRPHEQSWGMLRYLCAEPIRRHFACLPVPQVKFNYQGYAEQASSDCVLRGPLAIPIAGALHPDNARAYLLNLELAVVGGQLQCQCLYNRQLHRPERIEQLLTLFSAELARVAEQVRNDLSTAYLGLQKVGRHES